MSRFKPDGLEAPTAGVPKPVGILPKALEKMLVSEMNGYD